MLERLEDFEGAVVGCEGPTFSSGFAVDHAEAEKSIGQVAACFEVARFGGGKLLEDGAGLLHFGEDAVEVAAAIPAAIGDRE